MASTLNITARVNDRTKKGIDSANKRVGSLTGKIGGLKKAAKFAAIAVAGIAIAGVAIGVKLIGGLLSAGDALDKLNKKTGISIEELSALSFVLGQGGTNLETFEKGLATFAKGLADAQLKGTGPFADGLELIGLELEDLKGLDPVGQFDLLADAISAVEDPMLRSAAAQKVFGGAGKDLLPTLLEGSEGMARLRQEAEDTGRVMSTEAAQGAARFNDAIDSAKGFLKGLVLQGFSVVLPALLNFADFLKEKVGPIIRDTIIPAIRDFGDGIGNLVKPWKEKLEPALKKMIALFSGGGESGGASSLKGVLEAVKKTFEIVSEVIGAVIVLAVELIINNIVTLIEAFVGLVEFVKAVLSGDWAAAWDAITVIFQAFVDRVLGIIRPFLDLARRLFEIFGVDIGNIFGNIWQSAEDGANAFVRFFTTTVPNGIKGAINAIIGLIEAWPNAYVAAFNAILKAWNNFSISTPAVKLLGKTVIPSFRFDTPNLPLVPRVTIPRLQAGGIVTRRTLAEIGESGPEAVIPLGRGAGRLGSTTINVHVAGSVLTQHALETVVSNIATKLRRQGVI